MESTGNDTGAGRLDSAAEWAGYLGITPLVFCLAAVGLAPAYAARELALRCAIAWGAVLLAFAGAVHFGLALGGWLRWERGRVAAAFIPALIGAAAIVTGGQRAVALLVAGSGGFWLYEHRRVGAQLPAAYLNLRRPLALATCMLLALIMFLADAGGLG